MIFQLCVFSLLLLVLLLVSQFNSAWGAGPGGSQHGGSRIATERFARLDTVVIDAARTYLVFAAYALLLYLQGKPDLLPQYLGWIVVAVSVLKGITLFYQRMQYTRVLGVINVAILAFLWVQELPFFQVVPA